jgi:hypothetical protein
MSVQTDKMRSSTGGKGPQAVIDEQKAVIEGFSRRNASLDNSIADEANRMAAPQPRPAPASAPRTKPSAVPAGGARNVAAPAAGARNVAPNAGAPIGPVSPVAPVAPMTDAPAPNLRAASRPGADVNKAIDERNKELEKALNGG